jgi:hypothetical protein
MKKTEKSAVPKTVDEYLAKVPEPQRGTLKKVRAVIQSVVPEETTEVISYRMPIVKYKGMLDGYAAFTNHCSLFGMSATLLGPFKRGAEKVSDVEGNDSISGEQAAASDADQEAGEARDRGERREGKEDQVRLTLWDSPLVLSHPIAKVRR